MDYPKYFNPKNSSQLFGLKKNFIFLSSLYLKDKLPKVLMLSGSKGVGKSTLINHLLFSIFDERNYNKTKYTLSDSSSLYKKFKVEYFKIFYIWKVWFKSLKLMILEILNLLYYNHQLLIKIDL